MIPTSAHESTLRPKEIQTRFLYPFFFDRNRAREASALLMEATILARGDNPIKIWECCEPPALYKEELLDHVEKFLFPDTVRGCKYLRVSNPVGSRWFNKLQAVLVEPKLAKGASAQELKRAEQAIKSEAIIWPVSLVPLAGIEIFLTNYGVGILSISLTPNRVELDFQSATLFNYKLAQLRPQVSARLRISHPSENQAAWEHMSQQRKDESGSPPSADAVLTDRLGVPGGSFILGELATKVLLQPLDKIGLEATQMQFSVYTVVRFSGEVDFEQPEVARSLAAFLSGLSHVEEPSHAGAPVGVLGVTNAVLNRRHSAAVGLLGMAQIVSDQPIRDLSFNEQRLPRVMMKYFVPYLVALFQRTSLQRAQREASDLVLNQNLKIEPAFSTLRGYLLEFAVEGYFPEISYREVLDRYYRIVQEGLGVRRAYQDVSRAITDIDAKFAADHQANLAEAMAENVASTRSLQEQMTRHLRVMVNVQSSVGWIEVFFVSVYLAELWHLFATHIGPLQHWLPHGVIAAAILGALGAALILRPWKHSADKL